MNNPRISENEMYIMDYLWSKSAGAGIGDICIALEKSSKKEHKQQAVRVFLTRLQNKGYVKVYTNKETNRNVYVAAHSRAEFLQNESENVVNKLFKGSVFDFLVAFSGGVKISKDEADKIRKLLDE